MKDLERLFEKNKNDWDVYELNCNHGEVFLNKLNQKKVKRKYLVPMSIAASLFLLFGLVFMFKANQGRRNLEFASVETRQTDSIFTVIIENELEKIKGKKSLENEKIINDGLAQMKTLDDDYHKIIKELEANGECKQLIYAMISNLETRIAFLKNIMSQIEANEKLKLECYETAL